MKIERLKEQDIDEAYEIFFKMENLQDFPKHARKEHERVWSRENLRKKIKENMAMLVAKDNEKIIGLVFGNTPWAGVATVGWLWVDPDYRRKGVGSELLKKAIKFYEKLGCHKVCLTMRDQNLQKFYGKLDFIQEGFLKNHWWGKDYFHMSYIVKKMRK